MRHRWRSAFEFARVFVAMDEGGIKVSILFHANGFRRPIPDGHPYCRKLCGRWKADFGFRRKQSFTASAKNRKLSFSNDNHFFVCRSATQRQDSLGF